MSVFTRLSNFACVSRLVLIPAKKHIADTSLTLNITAWWLLLLQYVQMNDRKISVQSLFCKK